MNKNNSKNSSTVAYTGIVLIIVKSDCLRLITLQILSFLSSFYLSPAHCFGFNTHSCIVWVQCVSHHPSVLQCQTDRD